MKIGTILAALFLLTGYPVAGAQDDHVIQTTSFSRTVRADGGFLRSVKFEVYGKQILAAPSVEFMLELDHGGEFVTLAPADFEVKSVGKSESNRTQCVEFTLTCLRDEFPITLQVRYYSNRSWPYMQKQVLVRPFGRIRGTTLRRVVVEDLSLSDSLGLMDPAHCGGLINALAAYDEVAQTGIYWFQASTFGIEHLGRGRTVVVAEQCSQSMDSAYQTGRAVIGVARGGPQAVPQSLKDFLSDNFLAVRRKRPGPDFLDVTLDSSGSGTAESLARLEERSRALRKEGPNAAIRLTLDRPLLASDIHLLNVVDAVRIDCSKMSFLDYRRARWSALRALPPWAVQFIPPAAAADTAVSEEAAVVVFSLTESNTLASNAKSFRQRFEKYLTAYQSVLSCPDGSSIDGEAHTADNAGFVFLFNSSDESRKASLVLGPQELGLKGEVRLSDWTSLESGEPLKSVQAGETVDFEVPARSAIVVGINVE